MSVPLSVLDLAVVAPGGTIRDALGSSVVLAQRAEQWGYHRFWFAEHHNMPTIASSATSVLIGHVAAQTQRIRVGAGGVMLPNHSPLVIAEQFGTLETLFPGRIDLGLGRAPGGDQAMLRALRRDASAAERFPQDVIELRALLGPERPGQTVRAVPGTGTNVPLIILGSSLFGARLAAMLGLPYAFASHFAPAQMMQAIEVYRSRFRPSEHFQRPYLMLGYNVFAADTDAEAQYLATSMQQAFVNLRRGQPGKLQPPVEGYLEQLAPPERALLDQVLSCTAIGSPDSVRTQIKAFLERTGADELIITSQMFDHAARLRSYEIAAEVREALA